MNRQIPGLRKLQKQCTEKEESRKILQLLAVNSEYQENYENAGFYYEQMLLYDETYRAGYGEYGMFLFRTGKRKPVRHYGQNISRKKQC